MSIQRFDYFFNASKPLVEPRTGLLTGDGRDLILALLNRTGAGTGIVPKVTNTIDPGPLVAAGASSIDALELTQDWNIVGTVPVGSGVRILPLKPGNDIEVWNDGASPLNVYPPDSFQIDALAPNAPYVLPAGKFRIFQCWTLSQFLSLGN